MNVAYERREDPIKLKEMFITWGPTERKESGVWWRNRQEGKADAWGGPFLLQSHVLLPTLL